MGFNEFFDVLIKVDRMLMLSVVCNLILGGEIYHNELLIEFKRNS